MGNKVCLQLTLVSAAVLAIAKLLKGTLGKFLRAHHSLHSVLDWLGLLKALATATTLRLEMVIPAVSMALPRLWRSRASIGEPSLSCSPLLSYLQTLCRYMASYFFHFLLALSWRASVSYEKEQV